MHYTIKNITQIFSNAGYKLLFEGIEDHADEIRCQSIYANYLQGYKYSKPIEIHQLKNFLTLKNVE